jgi:glycosyltransferase involved in cell wall biosynthesis
MPETPAATQSGAGAWKGCSPPPRLSVIVRAHNEQLLLESTARALREVLDGCGVDSEIIVVNDGSRDRTASIADCLSVELPGVRVCHQPHRGLGSAFATGATIAAGEYLIMWPADMLPEAGDLAPLVARLGEADVIVGCRRGRAGYGPLMLLDAWIYPGLVRILFGLRARDVNWIHAYRASAFGSVRPTRRGITALTESLVRLRDGGASFAEAEVPMKERAQSFASASRLSVMWGTLAGLLAFWIAWRRERS